MTAMKPIQIAMLLLLTIMLVSSSSAVSIPSWSSIYAKSSGIAKGWKYIVIHHSGTDAGSADSFDRYHEKMGYGGLCYHFVIGNGNGTPDGKIETGFRWKEQIVGTHVDVNSWYHNIFGIGICLVGNFNKDRPTKKQMESLEKLVKKLMREQQIPASDVLPHNRVPVGEIDWDSKSIRVLLQADRYAATDCPGKNFPMTAFKKQFSP